VSQKKTGAFVAAAVRIDVCGGEVEAPRGPAVGFAKDAAAVCVTGPEILGDVMYSDILMRMGKKYVSQGGRGGDSGEE